MLQVSFTFGGLGEGGWGIEADAAPPRLLGMPFAADLEATHCYAILCSGQARIPFSAINILLVLSFFLLVKSLSILARITLSCLPLLLVFVFLVVMNLFSTSARFQEISQKSFLFRSVSLLEGGYHPTLCCGWARIPPFSNIFFSPYFFVPFFFRFLDAFLPAGSSSIRRADSDNTSRSLQR